MAGLCLLLLLLGAEPQLPQIYNGSMTEGVGTPEGWTNVWTGAGKLKVTRDTKEFQKGPSALCFESDGGPANGNVSQTFKPTATSFRVTGWVKTEGKLEECQVAVQSFAAEWKPIAWTQVADALPDKKWTSFSKDVEVPKEAVMCSLVFTLKGEGKAWLDEVELGPPAGK